MFVGLPTAEDRSAIFGVHVLKRRRDPAGFELEVLAARSDGYSGAEIDSCPVALAHD